MSLSALQPSARTLPTTHFGTKWRDHSTNHVTPLGAVDQLGFRKLGPPAVREDCAGSLSHFSRLVAFKGKRRVVRASVKYRQWREGPWNQSEST